MSKIQYIQSMFNREGFVVFLPSVGAAGDLIQSETIDIYGESSTQEFPLGTKLVNGERVWRYTKAGGTGLTLAAPVQTAAIQHAEAADDIVVGAASAIGSTTITLTSTSNLAVAADYYKEGYIIVNDAAGEGQMRKVKTSPALTGTATTEFTVYEPLTVELTTSSQCGIKKNTYDAVIATTAVCTGPPLGVPQFGVTASYYFWLQSGGPAAVTAKSAVALGTDVVVGTTAALVDPAAAATTEHTIGWPLTVGVADTESFMVFLTIDR